MSEKPYIERAATTVLREHNPKYNQSALCTCGHTYERHFDSYEHMEPIGCKYCPCFEFVAAPSNDDGTQPARTQVVA
jgi:hypothetical protein